MKYKPSILHVISKIDLSQGGPPRMVLNTAKFQRKLKYNVKILTSSKKNFNKENVIIGKLINNRFAIPNFNLINRIFSEVKKFDIIHIHNFWNIFVSIAIFAAKLNKKKIILSPHGSLHKENVKKNYILKMMFYKIFAKKLLRYINKFHFLNENEKKNFFFQKIIFNKKYFLVPNSIKKIKIKKRTLKKFNKSRNNFCYIGRISPNKGIEILLEGFLKYRKKNLDISMNIIGPESSYKKYLMKKFNSKKNSNNIFFHKPIYSEYRFSIMNSVNGVFLLSDLECDSILSKEVWASKGLLISSKKAFNEINLKKKIALIINRNKFSVSKILEKVIKNGNSIDNIKENGYMYSLNNLDISDNTKKLTISYL